MFDKLRRIGREATSGPWVWRKLGEHESLFADHGRRDVILCDARTRNDTGILVRAKAGMPNPEFIATSRNAWDLMLDVVEATELHCCPIDSKLVMDCGICQALTRLREFEEGLP
jgi:hypothetical protein